LTYCSNSDISERATASTSRVSRADSDSTTVPGSTKVVITPT
jgi:hypothetical protein